jgi:hypothetical protein
MPTDVTRTSVLDRLHRAGGMFIRDGSGAIGLCALACGRLLGFIEAHISSWNCLGALTVVDAAGGSVNGYLTSGALLQGNKIIAVLPQLRFHTSYEPRDADLHISSCSHRPPRTTDGGHTRRTRLGYPMVEGGSVQHHRSGRQGWNRHRSEPSGPHTVPTCRSPSHANASTAHAPS